MCAMWFEQHFADRRDAGRALAAALARFADDPDVVVLALPRGGVPVAFEVAEKLRAPLDVFVVRKLGVPGHEELAMGAIASGEILVHNRSVIDLLGIDDSDVEAVTIRERAELARRERAYRDTAPPLDVAGKIAVIVDDGIATGSSMRAAVEAVRGRGARVVVAAAPVAPPDVRDDLASLADDVVVIAAPEAFSSVGAFYDAFEQTTDAEVHDLLARSRAAAVPASDGAAAPR